MENKVQSIDGMVRQKAPAKKKPAPRRVTIQRQGVMDIGQSFISVRPRFQTDQPKSAPSKPRSIGDGEVEIVKSREGKAMVIPKLRQLSVPQILESDVVLKLPRKWSVRARVVMVLQYLAFAIIAVAAGYSTDIGQWFVLAYAIYALITKQDSRLSFGIALFVLVSVPFFQAINQPGVANNMAVYVYELLVVGTVQALIELRREPHTSDS